jgi:hypothetical protein
MFTTVMLLSAFALGAEDKAKAPYAEVTVEKIEIKPGAFNAPTVVADAEGLAKLVPDEVARAVIAKQIDFKTHKLVIFVWQGSGQDGIDVAVLESSPEQLVFTKKPGRTRDLRTHIKAYAVRNDVKYTAK